MMKLLETLQNIQQAHGYLPMEELKKLPWPTAEIVGTASFYSFFRFQPGAVEDHIENRYPCRNTGPLLTARQPYAFPALRAAEQAPESILPLLRAAELRGRGGAGFPVASKWELTKNTPSAEKYVVCNADEGEPGTGKDRAILSLRPETVVDGMAACAKTVGAAKGFLYLRAEYADLRAGIERSIRSAPLQGFDLQVRLGMGAYICGEETALLESLEGRRGEPRLKPPYPGAAGYDGCPTVINNVESFACAARIIAAGGHLDALTKLYTVCGCVSNPGGVRGPGGRYSRPARGHGRRAAGRAVPVRRPGGRREQTHPVPRCPGHAHGLRRLPQPGRQPWDGEPVVLLQPPVPLRPCGGDDGILRRSVLRLLRPLPGRSAHAGRASPCRAAGLGPNRGPGPLHPGRFPLCAGPGRRDAGAQLAGGVVRS